MTGANGTCIRLQIFLRKSTYNVVILHTKLWVNTEIRAKILVENVSLDVIHLLRRAHKFLELPHDSSTRKTVSTLLYTYLISQSYVIIMWGRKCTREGVWERSKNVAVYPKLYRYKIAYYQNKLYSGEYFQNKITVISSSLHL